MKIEYAIIKGYVHNATTNQLEDLDNELYLAGIEVYFNGLDSLTLNKAEYNALELSGMSDTLKAWYDRISDKSKTPIITDLEEVEKYDCDVYEMYDNEEIELVKSYERVDIKYIRDNYGPNSDNRTMTAFVIDPTTGEIVAEFSGLHK